MGKRGKLAEGKDTCAFVLNKSQIQKISEMEEFYLYKYKPLGKYQVKSTIIRDAIDRHYENDYKKYLEDKIGVKNNGKT